MFIKFSINLMELKSLIICSLDDWICFNNNEGLSFVIYQLIMDFNWHIHLSALFYCGTAERIKNQI